MNLKLQAQKAFNCLGYQVKKIDAFDPVFENEFRTIYKKCLGLHLQSVERLYALYQSVVYISKNSIPGALVECGVYKGASLILASYVLQNLYDSNRAMFLYDTFEGWPLQGTRDSQIQLTHNSEGSARAPWGNASALSLETVQQNIWKTGYPKENILFIKGKVEETLPKNIPDKIALLRLDTDGYESTYHELVHLYPRLSVNGVLMIDDYGHWQGAKDAVDQYFREKKMNLLFHRIDYTGRIAIRTQA